MTATLEFDLDLTLEDGEGVGGEVGGKAEAAAQPSPSPASRPKPKPYQEFEQLLIRTDTTIPYLIVDIETIPDESRRHLFGLDKPKEEAKPFRNPDIPMQNFLKETISKITEILNLHNPDDTFLESMVTWEKNSTKPRDGIVKLARNIQAARAGDGPEAEAERIKKMSLTPEMLRIVSVGIGVSSVGGGPNGKLERVASVVVDEAQGITEASILEWLWHWMARSRKVVGYNIIGFDLPAIFVRSTMLGVPPLRLFDLAPWKGEVIDLMALRFPRGQQSAKLKALAKCYGIDVPEEDVDGSQVYPLWQAGSRGAIGRYQRSDIAVTDSLYHLWQGYFFA